MNRIFYEVVRTAPKGRWNGIQRNYGPTEVYRLRSGVQIEHTLAVSILVKFFSNFCTTGLWFEHTYIFSCSKYEIKQAMYYGLSVHSI
jgi:isocitrate lyase